MLSALKAICSRAIDSIRQHTHPDRLSDHLSDRPLLSPLKPLLTHPSLVSLSPHPLAIGVSTGLMWAFLLPVAQIPFACLQAILLRGNLLAAALFTLVNNPLTLTPITLVSHHIGQSLFYRLWPTPPFNAFPSTSHPIEALHTAPSLFTTWFIGATALALLASAFGYTFTFAFAHLSRSRFPKD